jgi:GH15 family glucan-1,4-alpha-glucosidase
LQTAALVTTDGSIDWFCFPRFDSPIVYGALLDRRLDGRFQIRLGTDAFDTTQMYLPTAILVTRYLTEDGVGEVVHFMPVSGNVATDRHRLVRMVRCVRGKMTFEADLIEPSAT